MRWKSYGQLKKRLLFSAMMIVMEYAAGGTLYEYLESQLNQGKYLDEEEIGHLFAQIVLPLHMVHARNVLHRYGNKTMRRPWFKYYHDLVISVTLGRISNDGADRQRFFGEPGGQSILSATLADSSTWLPVDHRVLYCRELSSFACTEWFPNSSFSTLFIHGFRLHVLSFMFLLFGLSEFRSISTASRSMKLKIH